jgi:hypothetical protein
MKDMKIVYSILATATEGKSLCRVRRCGQKDNTEVGLKEVVCESLVHRIYWKAVVTKVMKPWVP